ncbi:gasdermin-D isoform X3 [Oryctolagus cuniculus]|uniref:gasdermin-D isoform X3 n=1 Tax=Oryctolagus cuniculus TaxID=9986 RepID=UPI003879490A
MPSAFKSVVRSVLRELDSGGQLTPVDSLHSSTSFRPYCLLGRKPSRSLFWKSRCGVQRLLRLRRCRGCTGAGQRGAGRPRAGEDRGRGCGLRQQQQLHESVQAASGHEHLGGHGPRQAPAAAGTQNPAAAAPSWGQRVRGDRGAADTAGGAGHPGPQAGGLRPVHTVRSRALADILLLPEKKWKTFQPLPPGDKPRSSSYSLVPHSGFEADAPAEWPVLTEDFQGLRAEVEAKLLELECWDRRLSRKLLGGLAPLLRDHQALGALESLLEQGLGREEPQPQDGPARAVFECLPRASGALVMEVANPIFYLVGALTVLSGTQQELLARALETGALVGQLELVGSFLEQSVPWEERSTVPLPPTLLGSSWGEDAAAWTLLEECGHEPQAGAPEVCWEPQAQGPTCALYASLALLARLSQ